MTFIDEEARAGENPEICRCTGSFFRNYQKTKREEEREDNSEQRIVKGKEEERAVSSGFRAVFKVTCHESLGEGRGGRFCRGARRVFE